MAIGKVVKLPTRTARRNRFIADQMAEADRVSARTATLRNPTADDETVQILRRRLSEHIDSSAGDQVAESYRRL